MIRRFLSACAGAVLLCTLTVPAPVAAKPPDLPEDGTFTAAPDATPATPSIETLPMPHEVDNVTCPYLRQKMIDRHAGQSTDPDMGRDVLENLKRLRRADKLLDKAKKLAKDGFIAEAIECCARAMELCPGSPCANRAADTMFDLALGFAVPSGASEEASEPQECPYCPKTGKPIREALTETKSPTIDYEIEVDVNSHGALRMGADCSLGSNVYHLRYKQGCLTIWKTEDASKTKP